MSKSVEILRQLVGMRPRERREGDPTVQVYDYSTPRLTESIKTAEQAMCLPTVYRCVDILSGTVAMMPLKYKRRAEGELYKVFEDSPTSDMLCGMANDQQTFFDMMGAVVAQRLLKGNAYLLPHWRAGEVYALTLLDPDAVFYDRKERLYRVNDYYNGIVESYKPSQIVHIKNRSLDGGYSGVSTIQYAARTLSLSATADSQTLDGLSSGNTQRGIVTGANVVQGLGAVQDSFMTSVANRLSRDFSSGKAIVEVPGTVEFKPLSITPADAQLLETRKFSPYDICRFFGVHPDMVFVSGGSSNTYQNHATSQLSFYQQTLAPILRQISTEMSCKLIPYSLRRKYKLEYDLDDVFVSDLKSRSEYYAKAIGSGILTPNEVRIKEGREPIAGGDTTFMSCNVFRLDGLGENAPSAPEAPRSPRNNDKTTNNNEPDE
jgi:HK97 family phage portal protein